MKKELLCEKCGEILRNSLQDKQMVVGAFALLSYGPIKPGVDAQKLQCDGCHKHFKIKDRAVCFSNWERDEQPEDWVYNYITEEEHVRM